MNKLINPFRYLPMRQAICWGIAVLIVTSIFVWQLGLRATSLTQVDFAGGPLWDATLRQMLIWMVYSVVLYIGGVIVSKSKVRFWDVASFNLFARIPFDITLLMFAIPSVKSIMAYMTDGNLNAMMEYVPTLTLIGLVSMFFSVWYFYWTYKAFAESTNVKNGKGVATFAVCWMITHAALIFLLRFVSTL